MMEISKLETTFRDIHQFKVFNTTNDTFAYTDHLKNVRSIYITIDAMQDSI